MGFFSFLKNKGTDSVLSSLTLDQKYAAIRVMYILAGACDGSPRQINQIDIIMSRACAMLGIPDSQVRMSQSNRYEDFMGVLKTIQNPKALEKLFVSYFQITKATQNKEALLLLINLYEELGYTNEELAAIIDRNQS